MPSLDSSLFPAADTELRPARRGDKKEVIPSAPALPELPPLPDRPRDEAEGLRPVADALPPQKTEPKITDCPRCKKKLVDPAGLGWCSNCGYCHSLEQDRAKIPVQKLVAAKKSKDPGTADVLLLLLKVPSWFWVMLAGAGLVALCTWLLIHTQPVTPVGRCVWCTIQIGLGALVLFVASFWALIQVAAEDETITAKDIFLPVRLWTLTCRRLPNTRCQVWLAVWGAVAILSAAAFVGGLGEWLKYLPKPSTAVISVPVETRHA
jgi:hypothetical protein